MVPAAAAGWLSGCGPVLVSLAEGPREYVATDYEVVRDRWTRTSELITIAQLDSLLRATATYESWDFRWAYVVRFVEDNRLTIEKRRKLLDQALEESRQGHHFYVAVTGGERRFNDLSKDSSAWIVRLIDSTGNETAPEEIRRIPKLTALDRTYYPYTTPFHLVFRLRFPRNVAGKPTVSERADWFGLRFAGPQGNSELVWTISGSPEPAPGDVAARHPGPSVTRDRAAR